MAFLGVAVNLCNTSVIVLTAPGERHGPPSVETS